MNKPYLKADQSGSIAVDGITLFELHDYYCLRHWDKIRREAKPIKMTQVINEETNKDDKILVTMGKSCPRCSQYLYEGEYTKP